MGTHQGYTAVTKILVPYMKEQNVVRYDQSILPEKSIINCNEIPHLES